MNNAQKTYEVRVNNVVEFRTHNLTNAAVVMGVRKHSLRKQDKLEIVVIENDV